MLKIPLGCILILRNDVFNVGIVRGNGNGWFHGVIIASEDLNSSSGVQYLIH